MPLPPSVCRLETADEVKCGNATDKALADEVISCSGSFKICDEAVITAGQLASLKRYTTKEKTNRLVGREWSQVSYGVIDDQQNSTASSLTLQVRR